MEEKDHLISITDDKKTRSFLTAALKPLIFFVTLPMTNQSWMELEVSLSLLLPGVCAEKKQSLLMAWELYDFLCEQMFVNSTYDSRKLMLESFI